MRILIISTFFPPLNSIASLRPYSWAKYWTISGHDITVLTVKRDLDPSLSLEFPNPGYKVIEVPLPQYAERWKASLTREGNSTFLHKLFSPIKSLFSRLLHYLRFKRGVFYACRMPDITHLWVKPAFKRIQGEGKWDLVISTAGPYTVHILAEKLKKQGMAKTWIADFRDPWSNNHIFPGIFPFSWIEKIWEKRLMRSADAITTISMPFAVRFALTHGNDKVHAVENGFDPIDLQSLNAQPVFSDDDKYRIVHTGTLYYGKQNLAPFFQAIQQMGNDPRYQQLIDKLEVIFVGPRQTTLKKLVEKYQVGSWVKTEGFVGREVALRLQRDAHSLLFFPWDDPTTNGALSGKIFEYLFSRTPILAVAGKGYESSQELVLEAKAGKIVTNVEDIKRFLSTQLRLMPKKKNNIDPSFLSRYDRKALASKVLDIAKRCKQRSSL